MSRHYLVASNTEGYFGIIRWDCVKSDRKRPFWQGKWPKVTCVPNSLLRCLPLMFSTILSLVLLPTICSASSAAQVYLHPHSASTDQAIAPHALLAHHLGLEAFESLPTGWSGEIEMGGPHAFVGEGLGDAMLVLVDPGRPGGRSPPRKRQSTDILPQMWCPSLSNQLSNFHHHCP